MLTRITQTSNTRDKEKLVTRNINQRKQQIETGTGSMNFISPSPPIPGHPGPGQVPRGQRRKIPEEMTGVTGSCGKPTKGYGIVEHKQGCIFHGYLIGISLKVVKQIKGHFNISSTAWAVIPSTGITRLIYYYVTAN